jgi:hypothetical protein
MAGQGTVGLEILEDVPDADAIVVPVGGGGLLAGVSLAVKTLKKNCKIIVSTAFIKHEINCSKDLTYFYDSNIYFSPEKFFPLFLYFFCQRILDKCYNIISY